jgi:uncharacterized Zn-binding protein involved in type VI secretion
MAAAARAGDICTGHGCFPPRTGSTTCFNVLINGRPPHLMGDFWNFHCCPKMGCHPGVVAGGSSTVFINGRPAARMGDSVGCGSIIAMGSSNVFIGG